MRRYALPLCSGVLLALSLYPFSLWPLAFIALVPFFYFVTLHYPRRTLFWGGFLCGAVAVGPTLYCTLLQLLPQPGAPTLTLAVHVSSVFFLAGIATLFGLLGVSIQVLRTRSALVNISLAAALYTLLELALFWVFSGYYYASLAYALVPFAPTMLLAAVGGVSLIVYAVTWLAAALAERAYSLCTVGVLLLALLCSAAWYQAAHTPISGVLSVALLQRAPQELDDVLIPPSTPFVNTQLGSLIAEGSPAELVVYPFSPVEATYEGAAPAAFTFATAAPQTALGLWLANLVPASTTVVLWDTTAKGGLLFDTFDAWQGGVLQEYQKHYPHPLSDYTPSWLRMFGVARKPYEIVAGSADGLSVARYKLGGLACSELHNAGYVRAQAHKSAVLLAIGYEGFFPGTLAATWSLQAARLRAAENGTPLVRAYIFGPSALILADGSVATSTRPGSTGVLQGTLAIQKIPTLYASTGDLFAGVLVVGSLSAALYTRSRSRDSEDQ